MMDKMLTSGEKKLASLLKTQKAPLLGFLNKYVLNNEN